MGRHKLIENPEQLLDLFKQYQDYCKANPVFKEDYVGKDANRVFRELERPLTWVGFECFLSDREIINDLGDYESNKDNRYEEYATIISRIKKYIECDQFTGATVGIYNHNIIARKLGLVDKHDSSVDATVTGGVTDTQFAAILEAVKQNATPPGESE